jgi:hypothetical protein
MSTPVHFHREEPDMRNHRTALMAILMLTAWSTLAGGQERVDTNPEVDVTVQWDRVCAREFGVIVCRDSRPTSPEEKLGVAGQPLFEPPSESGYLGKLMVLLDIPSNIFYRLAQNPAYNREYHPTPSFKYQPIPPAPQSAGDYAPPAPTPTGEPVWRYHPTNFTYRPKTDWTYNRDVYGRIWRANIMHDTRVVEFPVEAPGIYLLPVAAPQ